MTTARLGLMGFGRIGRNAFRMAAGRSDVEIAAIADIDDPKGLTYLLKYDSIHGRFPEPVEYADGHLVHGDRKIPFLDAKAPGDAPWAELGVDIVVQATGGYRTRAECQKHIDAGASGVILASTPDDPSEIPIVLRGVNDADGAGASIVSLGSNTSNALAPVLEILDSAFGVDRAFFTTVHAMTNSQRLADVPSSGFRQSRAAGENIIPSDTNSADIIQQALPAFHGKLAGAALNVPVSDGSTVDLVAHVERATDITSVNAAVKEAADTRYRGILGYSVDPIVSSDVRTDPESGIFDSLSTMVMSGNMVKTITWYNNGWGYTARVLETAVEMAAQLEGASA